MQEIEEERKLKKIGKKRHKDYLPF